MPSDRQDPRFNRGLLGGSLLQQMMAPMDQRVVSFEAKPEPELEVLPLPEEGRPENFTGAVGQFQFASVEREGETAIEFGEPISVRAVIEGAGNFALLSQPTPEDSANWRSYRAEENFQSEDPTGFEGSKSFRWSLAPRQGGQQSLVVGFSYFDPQAGEYRELRSQPLEFEVSGELEAKQGALVTQQADQDKVVGEDLGLADRPGRLRSLQSWSDSSWYQPGLGGLLGLALAFVLVGVVRRVRARGESAQIRARAKERRRALARAERAMKEENVETFYQAAREFLALSVVAPAEQPPQVVTIEDLQRAGLSTGGTRSILRDGDAREFGGQVLDAERLRSQLETLRNLP